MEIGQVVKDMTNLHAVDRRLTSDIIVQLETEKMGKYIMQMWSQGGQERLCGFETMLAPGEVIILGTVKTAITKGATATKMLYTGELQNTWSKYWWNCKQRNRKGLAFSQH